MRKIVISVSLAAETVEQLERLAHEKRVSLSSFARQLIEKGLEKQ